MGRLVRGLILWKLFKESPEGPNKSFKNQTGGVVVFLEGKCDFHQNAKTYAVKAWFC